MPALLSCWADSEPLPTWAQGQNSQAAFQPWHTSHLGLTGLVSPVGWVLSAASALGWACHTMAQFTARPREREGPAWLSQDGPGRRHHGAQTALLAAGC